MKSIFASLALAVLATAATAQTFDATKFPPPNEVPPITSPEVQGWLKGMDFSDVPKITPNTGNPPTCPALAQIPKDNCWWTCQSCPGTDIESCPTPMDWGLTFDDGPTNNTVELLKILKTNNVHASFFVMGTNVVRNPDILKQEVAEGHHIASHTWSHHPLTTLSNEQIVAEMKWTEKAVQDITGLQMKYMRPPYGDIDNRVRGVLKKLGYIVIDWTSDAFDTKDFNLNATPNNETALATAVSTISKTIADYATKPGAKGIITLEHDLYPVTIEFARRLIPIAAQNKLNVKTVAQCLNDNSPYQNNPPNGGKPNGGSGAGNGTSDKAPNVVDKKGAAARSTVAGGMMVALTLVAAVAAF